MKQFFKNLTFNKICSIAFITLFAVILFLMAVGGRHRVITALRNAEGKSIVEIKDDIDSTYNDGVYRKFDYINLCGLSARLMGMNELNGIIKLNNGHLSDIPGVAEYDEKNAEKLYEFKTYLDNKGIDLLYMQVPMKGGENSGLNPEGRDDSGEMLYASLAASLEKYGINTLNMKQEIKESGADYNESFYVTDHHWTIRTAFFAYSRIIDFFNENFGTFIDAKYTDLNNFDITMYEKLFLGSHGKKVGAYFTERGMDDFELITPKEELDSELVFDIISKNKVRKGNFKEALIEESYLEYGAYFELNPYGAYLGGNYALAKITNENAPCDKKILMLTDSCGYPVISFMSLVFKEIEYVDLRYYRDSSFVDVLESYDPDIMLFAYGMPRVLSNDAFEFFEKLETEPKRE
ncbi:MAG: hypothetical protein IJO48_03260 [Clostridia bacterium]|nr:hypothetical protein [Clostridia bacterium]